MSELFDLTVKEVISDPTAAKAIKLLAKAREEGWHENPFTSLVIRLGKDGAVPFFIRWDLGVGTGGKPSWRFAGARAANGQQLNYNDALLYLEDQTVILPEDPDANPGEEGSVNDCNA